MTHQVSRTFPSNRQNILNNLQGKEWIKFTKSWFVMNPSPRRDKLVHPACFPEALAAEFIKFFTKKEQWVFDPFAGVASTLIAAKGLGRNSVGVEIYSDYVALANRRLQKLKSKSKSIMIQGDSRRVRAIFHKHRLPAMNFCFTSPPYWNQLKNNSERQKVRVKNGFRTTYGNDLRDLSKIGDYDEFLEQLETVFDNVYEVMADESYVVVVANNTYCQGKLWPLAFDIFHMLSKKWTPKDEKIWCQDDKKLFPFGMFHSYIGNRSHHYCLVFKKDRY